VDFTRQSPLIGPKIPVHGLLVDIQTGKLEWLVNGYQALSLAVDQSSVPQTAAPGSVPLDKLPAFNLGEMKFPDFKIGETVAALAAPVLQKVEVTLSRPVESQPQKSPGLRFNKTALFKVVGNDQKIYGPVSGEEIEQWLAEDRVGADSRAQKVGYKEWKPLGTFAEGESHPPIPMPPPLLPNLHGRKRR